jgi:hypothetical protein
MAKDSDPRDTSIPGEDRMAEQAGPRDTSIPDEPSSTEQAEGSRENANVESGITNRPIEEEQREQQQLPPRGQSKEGGHA